MDCYLSKWLLLAAVILVVPCLSAPVEGDGKLLTQILQKVNTVLDNIIAKQEDAKSTKTDVVLQLDARNEDDVQSLERTARWSVGDSNVLAERSLESALRKVCNKFRQYGIILPECQKGGVYSIPVAERSLDTALNLEPKDHINNVLRQVCAKFRKYGIKLPECELSDPGSHVQSERSVDTEENLERAEKNINADIGSDAEKRNQEDEDEKLKAEVSEPEPAPLEKADLSLEQVLDYLRYLRSQKNSRD